jgi:ABC-type multidrug transport system fused ATPase/permease subunit
MERPRDSGETEVKLSLNETSLAQAMRKVICAKKKGGPIMKTVSKPLAARRNQDSPISDSLLVNMAIIGVVLMFVAAVWIFFATDPYWAWLDGLITGLFVIAIAMLANLTPERGRRDGRSRGRIRHLDRSRQRGNAGRRLHLRKNSGPPWTPARRILCDQRRRIVAYSVPN